MLNFGKLASNVLNSIDNAAKETLDEGAAAGPSATQIRSQRRQATQDGNTTTGDDAGPADGSSKGVVDVTTTNEIDRLNAECLELEDQVASLKKEVQEAWDSYKVAQERAALREAELQDELKQVQKAKHTDKQSLLSQMGKVGEEVDGAVKQMRAMQAERDSLQGQLRQMMDANAQWAAKEAALEGQLAEARAGSMQGAQGLREEMRAIVSSSEQMRSEHASLLRQSQVRQAELEQANVELTIGITEKQREISRLKLSLERAGKEDSEGVVREVDGVRQQMSALSTQLEEERQRYQQQERRTRHVECESKASAMHWEDEKQRLQGTIASLEGTISGLEDRLLKDKGGSATTRKLLYTSTTNNSNSSGNSSGNIAGSRSGKEGEDDGTSSMEGSGVLVMTADHEIRADLTAQVQNLTKQLLKKQGILMDVQAERAALKSRNQDLQARCSKAEQQLAVWRGQDEDGLEGGGGGYEEGGAFAASSSGSGGGVGLKQRRGEGSEGYSQAMDNYSKVASNHKVITDLEKMGVRPTEGVKRAVVLIDSYTFMTGKFLRRYPLIRLLFLCYLLFLHLWVFFIIGIHTHSLELDTTPQQAMSRIK
jgi:predicted  nucleic acid-binding Zn-ribbon protein